MRVSNLSLRVKPQRSSAPTPATINPWPKQSPHSGARQPSSWRLPNFSVSMITCALRSPGRVTVAIACLGCSWLRRSGNSGAAMATLAKGARGSINSWRSTQHQLIRSPAPHASTGCMQRRGWLPISTTTPRPPSSSSPAWPYARSMITPRAKPISCSTLRDRRAHWGTTHAQSRLPIRR